MSSLYDSAGAIRDLHRTVVEIKKILATALEGGGMNQYSPTHICRDGDKHTVSINDCPICSPNPAPTPAPTEVIEKPVAWMYRFQARDSDGIMRDCVSLSEREMNAATPLYAHPAVKNAVFENKMYVQVASILNEYHDRLTALERAGETKITYPDICPVCNGFIPFGCHDEHMREHGYDKPAPTPATVERYKVYAYEYEHHHSSPNATYPTYQRAQVGEVVATRDNNGWWRLCLEPNKWSSVYSQEQYEWLVGMMLKSGAWERTND